MNNDAVNLEIKLGMMKQIKALTARAEEAEAKLAEYENQEPECLVTTSFAGIKRITLLVKCYL